MSEPEFLDTPRYVIALALFASMALIYAAAVVVAVLA